MDLDRDELVERMAKGGFVNRSKQDEEIIIPTDPPFLHHARQYIIEETEISIDEDRVAMMTLVHHIRSVLQDIFNQENYIDEFHDQMEEYTKQVKGWNSEDAGNPFETYIVIFPLRFPRDWVLPARLSSRGYDMTQIADDEWDKYTTLVKEKWRYADQYKQISPHGFKAEGFTYWKVRCEANDAIYASYMVAQIVNLLLAKLNYIGLKTKFLENRLMGFFYSYFDTPYIFFTFDERGGFQHVQSVDLESRLVESLNWDRYNVFEKVERLPMFVWPEDNGLGGIDELLVHALYQYQRAITVSDVYQAFAGFWRCIEILTQKDSDVSAAKAIQRAEYIYRDRSGHVTRDFEYFLATLRDTRNGYIHKGVSAADITQIDYLHIKALCEEMFDFYFDNYGKNVEKKDFEDYLRLSIQEPDWREKMDKLRRLDQRFHDRC